MASYLLLRDNKQNGPFTFEELKAKGLKAYDLVWVEGRSAAWRYPGEIEELKPFSPPVVEQPFDRFYRKNPVVTTPEEKVIQNQPQAAEKVNPTVYQQASLQTARGNVYVTLPQAKNTNSRREVFLENPRGATEQVIKTAGPARNDFERVEALPPSVSFHEEPISRQGPKEGSFESEKRPSVKRAALPEGYQKALFIGLGVFLLLGLGIFIGVSINKPASATVTKMDNPNPAPQQPTDNAAAAIPVSANLIEQKQENSQQVNPETAQDKLPAKNEELVSTPEKKKIALPKKQNTEKQENNAILPQTRDSNNTVFTNPLTHREAVHRDDPGLNDMESIKNKLVNLVTISSNKYTVGTFGGISELQLTVSNKSVHALDLVIVEVKYLQANKKIFKTENIYYHNINAGQSLMQEAPKSPRGIKIQTRITVINCSEPGLSYSGL
jgi:hypothetical protein